MNINSNVKILMSGEKIKSIFSILKAEIKAEQTKFKYDSEYTLVVSVVLAAHSNYERVDKVTPRLFQLANTPEKMIELGFDKLKEEIKSIYLCNNKAKYIIGLSKMLIEKFESKIPETRDELMMLPGIGRKSADIILNALYKKPTIGVDTHDSRLCYRLGIIDALNPGKIADALEAFLPKYLDHETLMIAHNLMIIHARNICTAKNPKCSECSLKEYCAFYKGIKNAD